MSDAIISRRQAWKEKMERWEASGQTIKNWCNANNISYHTFQYWRQRLGTKMKEGQTSTPPFIQLDLAPKKVHN